MPYTDKEKARRYKREYMREYRKRQKRKMQKFAEEYPSIYEIVFGKKPKVEKEKEMRETKEEEVIDVGEETF